jgi:anhydro-N-acetylmuramic acid kinase
VLATRLGLPVVSDFRPADMAAGGHGAPLVPFLDLLVFRHPRRGRIVQNIGGIANLTAIPAAAGAEQVLAFDTGPGNMVIDALCETLFGRTYDDRGRFAAKGNVLDAVLAAQMKHPFFRRQGPRTAGREEFGREFVAEFLKQCGRADKHDVLATATALTARSIGEAVRKLTKAGRYHDLFVSGGGTRNLTLMKMIRHEVAALGIEVLPTDAAGVPSQAKEAVAFAVLAYQTWHRLPSNVPGATGAHREVILGKVSYA